jgi:hypothetical protein
MPQKGYTQFPRQKLSKAKKDKKWAIACIEAGESLAVFRNSNVRQSYKNKLINYNLANDILDTEDIERVCNPMGIKGAEFPAKMQNYPIANPKIDLLVGEERKRRFDWKVRVRNDDAISEVENQKKAELMELVTQAIKEEAFDENDLKRRLESLNKYHTYEFQDLKERQASQILNHLHRELNLHDAFSRGFEDMLISSEEIYCADIIAGEPQLRRVNPLNLHTVRLGESPYIEDADIIVEDGYHSPGSVIDMYVDYLSDKDIKQIDEGIDMANNDDFISIGEKEQSIVIDGILDVHSGQNRMFGDSYDTEGNIRVVRVVWRSLKKVGKLTYIDEDGDEQYEIVSEDYKKQEGDDIEWMWVGEWWEGTKIGRDIYVKIQPRPIQFRSMTNPSKCASGYVGVAYNINNSKAKSLMDRMKPYQYLYNVFMYRTELAFAKSKGKIAKLNTAKVPDGWDVDKWMYYAEVMGWAVEDPFKEAKKGAATGKLAGTMNESAPVIDMEMGNYIQQHILMLQFIEQQLGEIAGVSKQRQGQVENRESVGGVERAVTQSSHITEKLFQVHSEVKLKALTVLLETAKYAWRGKNKKVRYVLDDLSTELLQLDGAQFNEAEYGLFVSHSASDSQLMDAIKQLAHAGIQNDKINFSQLMDIYLSSSLTDMRRKIEKAEQDKAQRDQEAQQQAQEMQTQQLQAAAQEAEKAHQRDLEKLEREYDRKDQLEFIKLEGKFNEKSVDLDRDGIPDQLELQKVQSQERVKKMELEHNAREAEKERAHEAKENQKERDNKLQIAKSKPKPTAKK